MTNLDKYLSEIDERCRKTTNGDWHWKAASPSAARVWADSGPVINEKIYIGDAEFICAARTDVPRLKAMVALLHTALESSLCVGNGADHLSSCNKCARLAELERISGEGK